MFKHIRFFFRRYMVLIMLSIVVLFILNLYLGYAVAVHPVTGNLKESPGAIIEKVSGGLLKAKVVHLSFRRREKPCLQRAAPGPYSLTMQPVMLSGVTTRRRKYPAISHQQILPVFLVIT